MITQSAALNQQQGGSAALRIQMTVSRHYYDCVMFALSSAVVRAPAMG